MFYEKPSDIPKIAARTSCAIFVTDKVPKFKNALILEPEDQKSSITVEQMRDFLALSNNRETTDRYFIIAPADLLNDAAQNAFLKTFEEPHDFCHFLLFTTHPGLLLPTIRSRAPLYLQKITDTLSTPPSAKPKIEELARELISARPTELPALANTIASKKPLPRPIALEATATAIEILYKSYFKTMNPRFLPKIDSLIHLYDALERNGHIKLHIVADLC